LVARTASGGLVQTGAGLHLPATGLKWDVNGARLSDSIAKWTGSGKKAGYKPAKDTEQLVQVPASKAQTLEKSIKSAVQTLRLSDFLSGVTPQETQKQVERMYAKMDPNDLTQWKQKLAFMEPKSVKAQMKQINHFKNMLENKLSTTPEQDSPKAAKMRDELQELLMKKEALKKRISKEEDKELAKHGIVWHKKAKPGADASQYELSRLSRSEDSHATYTKWLASSAGGHRAATHHRGRQVAAVKPRITAGGYLDWNRKEAKRRELQAKSLVRLRARQARVQALSEQDNTHTRSFRRGRKESDADILQDAMQQDHPDIGASVYQRAAYKVNRWMGGGYVNVYG